MRFCHLGFIISGILLFNERKKYSGTLILSNFRTPFAGRNIFSSMPFLFQIGSHNGLTFLEEPICLLLEPLPFTSQDGSFLHPRSTEKLFR